MASLHGSEIHYGIKRGQAKERLVDRARRSSHAGAHELPASLVPEVPQNDVASRWSWVTPNAGSVRHILTSQRSSACFRERRSPLRSKPLS